MDNAASLALCIPTYERKDMVEDFLVRCSEYYIAAGIDIYYYDSSVSDETETLLREWADGEHIYYVRMSSELHPNAKAFKIFQGYGLKKQYDFIWLSNDGLQCSKQGIEQLMPNLSLEYDIIEVMDAEKDYNNVGTRIFTDPNEFMQKCVWSSGLFGATILNVHTMLNGVDWESYEKRFLVEPVIFLSNISFYFWRLLELDHFCAFFLRMPWRSFINSKLKKTTGWARNYFYVICGGCVQMMEGLPDYYTSTSKERAMLEIECFRERKYIYRYKQRGIYSMGIFLKYWSVWKKTTSIPRWELFLVTLIPGPVVKMFYNLREMTGRMKLQRFCAAHERIIIYGTGNTGDAYARCFGRLGIPFEAFCVSRRKPRHAGLDHPVYELSELKNAADGTGFVLAMDKSNVEEVLPAVRKVVGNRDIFYNFKFSEDIINREILRAQNLLWE